MVLGAPRSKCYLNGCIEELVGSHVTKPSVPQDGFPTHDVRAIGRKLEGTDVSSSAVALPISFTAATFH